jgi:hypothetical protein
MKKRYIATHKDENISNEEYGEGSTPDEAYLDWLNGEAKYLAVEDYGFTEGQEIEISIWTRREATKSEIDDYGWGWVCDNLIEERIYKVAYEDIKEYL